MQEAAWSLTELPPYPICLSAPSAWSDPDYQGDREIGNGGLVLYVEGSPCQFIVIKVEMLMNGSNQFYIGEPERRIEKGNRVKICTRIGHYVLIHRKFEVDDDGLLTVEYMEDWFDGDGKAKSDSKDTKKPVQEKPAVDKKQEEKDAIAEKVEKAKMELNAQMQMGDVDDF